MVSSNQTPFLHKLTALFYPLSGLSLVLLHCTDWRRGLLGALAVATALYLTRGRTKLPGAGGTRTALVSLLLALLTVGTLVANFPKQAEGGALAAIITGTLLQYLYAAACGALSGYFVWVTTDFILSALLRSRDDSAAPAAGLTKADALLCAGSALVCITLCSRSSPLYPMNDWMDANAFFTVGKSMWEGLMPYRDLYDQKGPLLYLLHAMATLVSNTSFFGVYLLELIPAAAFLAISMQTIRLYRPEASNLWIPVIAAIVYSSRAFCQGDSVEELCLPLIAYGMYLGLKTLRTSTEITFRECLMLGITSGCVLWLKYSLLGFYIGWFLVYASARILEKNSSAIFKTSGSIALGVVLVSLPILGFYGINGALLDMWDVYFYNNIFSYSDASVEAISSSPIFALFTGYLSFARFNPIVLIIVIIGLFHPNISKKERLLQLSCAVVMFLLIYGSGRRYMYYSLAYAALLPLGIAATDQLLPLMKKNISALVCIGCLVFTLTQSENIPFMAADKSDLPQYKFAAIIKNTQDATLLNYGILDAGFYFAADIVPNCRYFCHLNIPMPEFAENQNRYLREGLTDFVVTQDRKLDVSNYTLISEAAYNAEGEYRTYYLYQLNTR